MKLLFWSALIFSSMVFADEKIAVIDLEAAILATSDGKLAQRNLMKEFKLSETRFKEREYSLRGKISDFAKKAMILSEQKREEQKAEFQEMAVNLQRDVQKFQINFQKRQMEASRPIVEKLQKCILKLAKENDFHMILNKSQGQVLWIKPTADITEVVVKMYESKGAS